MALDDIFKEIGHTLEEAGKTALRSGVDTIRTVLAEKFAGTEAGQRTIQEFKFREIGKVFPWIILGVLGIFILGRLARG